MINSGFTRAWSAWWAQRLRPGVAALILASLPALAAPSTVNGGAGDSPLQSGPAAAAALGPVEERELQALRAPLLHLRVTSPYGERLNPIMRRKVFHRGVDYGAASGTPVYAAQSGTVVAVGMQDHAGIYLRLRHSGRVETLYAHLHRIMPGLRPGSFLRGGDILGFVGASGFATGPHLHYEVLLAGRPVDPELCCNPLELVSRREP
ncbi:MAG TPA: M23 family metallopeptidase [Nevskia sp.]|jgi:murein DD-endopeptidase MepM/ murein hydrolase activator NlpD|nr:M23 family metallopeptidase [Nevskia sp.]